VAEASSSASSESLACASCRNRKLKCDRTRPICSRCAKSKIDCVYPESRRKPTTKRRNVRELEERIGWSAPLTMPFGDLTEEKILQPRLRAC
jgi:hypothetical protein